MTSISKDEILNDYELAWASRHGSLIGRREVLTGKAKFGIFGDGKELAQIALAKALLPGDWRSGYYRDQTMMMALKACDLDTFFAQLYADPNPEHEPASAGRQMNSHFATHLLSETGEWKDQLKQFNSSSDISPTAGQMARLVGLAYASKLYRNQKSLAHLSKFSKNGDEVAVGTIGNASTSEGQFWEAMNAAGVLRIPLAMVVWDDGYGISVPQEYHTTKGSISDLMSGFVLDNKERPKQFSPGIRIKKMKGWNYQELVEGFSEGIKQIRMDHLPCLFHIVEMTQPQGHSTSGSHERYKSKERLQMEVDLDCLHKFRQWILEQKIASSEELDEKESLALSQAEAAKTKAWTRFLQPIQSDRERLNDILQEVSSNSEAALPYVQELKALPSLNRRSIHSIARRALIKLTSNAQVDVSPLRRFVDSYAIENRKRFNSYLHVEGERSPLRVQAVEATYDTPAKEVDGRQIIHDLFDELLASDPRIFVIGEDVGRIGGVNAEFEGLQEKYGELRVTDTGIREATIVGQGIGAALRGLRPVVEIQYLDYVLYALQTMSDDLASLHYRTAGKQASPLIILTRGHRLEGIWHTGSPLGTIINSVRGIHVCVPRNLVQAAGFYNTLLEGDDPGLVIEVLNGYRVKEKLPNNLRQLRTPLGVPEVLKQGEHLTLVTYGACVRIAEDACRFLETLGISVELIDIQCLLPFDRYQKCKESIQKTNLLMILDEDVPGGASAYILREILETQGAFEYLDGAPRVLSAQAHRGAYASDGDYYSKPNAEDIIELALEMIKERRA